MTKIRDNIIVVTYIFFVATLALLVPTIRVIRHGYDSASIYFCLMLAVVLFFILPLCYAASVTNKVLSRRAKSLKTENASTLGMTGVRVLVFFATVAIFSAAFLVSANANELLFRRVGFAALTERSLKLSLVELVLQRSYAEIAEPLICAGLVLLGLLFRQRHAARWYCLILWAASLLTYAIFCTFNNRFQSAIFLLSIVLVLSYYSSFFQERKDLFLRLILAFPFLVVYSFMVTENVRNQVTLNGCVDINAANPFLSNLQLYKKSRALDWSCTGIVMKDNDTDGMREKLAKIEILHSRQSDIDADLETNISGSLSRELTIRLDGLFQMTQITPIALERGWGWGRFWVEPMLIYSYYYFFDHDKYVEIKRTHKTNPKVYIADYYMGGNLVDMPSLVLVDLYANFFLIGFFIGGITIGALLGWLQFCFTHSVGFIQLCFALFILRGVLYVEREYLSLIFNTLKFSLQIIVIAWPLRRLHIAPQVRPMPVLDSGS